VTFFAPTAVVVDVAAVAQPASVPLSQTAPADAPVMAARSSASTPGAVTVMEEPAVTCAWHAVVPSQAVEPSAVLVERCPSGPAVASAEAVRLAVQPASGHEAWEPACPLPEKVGTASSVRASWAVALLLTTQPEAAAVQVASVRELPARPEVAPVVVAVQPAVMQ
jgi:hypothetical protein